MTALLPLRRRDHQSDTAREEGGISRVGTDVSGSDLVLGAAFVGLAVLAAS